MRWSGGQDAEAEHAAQGRLANGQAGQRACRVHLDVYADVGIILTRSGTPCVGGPPRCRRSRQGAAEDLYRAGPGRGAGRPGGVLRFELGPPVPAGRPVWEQAWEAFTPFLAFSPAVRKLLYTTNAIESLNYQLRKVAKARGHFPGDDAVVKLLWLAIINIEDKRARERAARRQEAASARTSPPAWSRASASPAGARPSTSSTVPARAD